MTTKPIETIFVDDRKELYQPLMASEWAEKTLDARTATPRISRLVGDFLVDWRSISMTAAMPATIVDLVISFAQGYTNSHTPDSSIVKYGQHALHGLRLVVPELTADPVLQRKIQEHLVDLLFKMRDVEENVQLEYPADELWRGYLTVPQFQMMLWSSQRVAFSAYYNAYENLLVRFAKTAAGLDSLRVTNKSEFNKCLREQFGDDGRDKCWTNDKVNLFRVVRHSLSHAGGRLTDDLAKLKHGLHLIDGKIQITPVENHAVVRTLQSCVDVLIEKASIHQAFQ